MSLKVAFVQPVVPSYRAPVFEALAALPGIDLTVVADLDSPDRGFGIVREGTGFRLLHSRLVRIGPFLRQGGLMAVARDPQYSVVVYEWSSRRVQLNTAIRAAHAAHKGVALWGHAHGSTLPWLGRTIRRRSAALADCLILYGPRDREQLLRDGYAAAKLFVAPNAIDQSPIQRARNYWLSQHRLRDFQRQQGLENTALLLFISRLERNKRPELLIDALAEIRPRRPDAAVVFVGDGSARASLERKARSLGVADAIRFTGALHDEMQIAPWALSSACLVHPERLGLSLLHAYGYGLPVITTNEAGLQGPEVEVLHPGVNGLTFRHRDVSDLASCILRLIQDDALREHMSACAAATVSGSEGRDLPGMVEGLAKAIRAAALAASPSGGDS